ncbi:hypothetical protein CMUS01_00283 [Colletotrichum musicola]|uniref:Uncharacterized protein n=1 Tax=Colletotrichum musicola TaxID=2175873 RepID=A0A8H6NZ51_9PEZI|nr:hypothetical protein CMUS01_00283 [Colletotrichum musicola]
MPRPVSLHAILDSVVSPLWTELTSTLRRGEEEDAEAEAEAFISTRVQRLDFCSFLGARFHEALQNHAQGVRSWSSSRAAEVSPS